MSNLERAICSLCFELKSVSFSFSVTILVLKIEYILIPANANRNPIIVSKIFVVLSQ